MNARDKANQATIAEAAEILNVPLDSLKDAVRRGTIEYRLELRPVVQERNVCVVDLADVEAWAESRVSTGPRHGNIRPLESYDPHELARIRGIEYQSARKAILRARRRAK